MFKKSFAPIIAHNPRVLILGSLPGDRSLIEDQYYAHPQNRFWPVMTILLNGNHDANYNKRVDLLQKNGICLWDVCKSAKRAGSMDTDIRQEVPNDIAHLLDQHPSISSILFNGKKAQQLFDRHHTRRPDIHYRTLPSTSPANARSNKSQLVQVWGFVNDLLTSPS